MKLILAQWCQEMANASEILAEAAPTEEEEAYYFGAMEAFNKVWEKLNEEAAPKYKSKSEE